MFKIKKGWTFLKKESVEEEAIKEAEEESNSATIDLMVN